MRRWRDMKCHGMPALNLPSFIERSSSNFSGFVHSGEARKSRQHVGPIRFGGS